MEGVGVNKRVSDWLGGRVSAGGAPLIRLGERIGPYSVFYDQSKVNPLIGSYEHI